MTKDIPQTDTVIAFGPFELGADLRRDGLVVDLTPKAYAVLRLLAEHAGELVTKNELWDAVWPRVIVTDAALTVCIAEVRKALGDNARNARFVATVPKRGYRFVAPIARHEAEPQSVTHGVGEASAPSPMFVGRDNEIKKLKKCLIQTAGSERQVCAIIGEIGIGKTALVTRFTEMVETQDSVVTAVGHCAEQRGPGESYMPVLDALVYACRGPHGAHLLTVLCRYAPLWVMQCPGLVDAQTFDSLSARTVQATPERMLRELAVAVEEATRDRPLLICIEDIQWADSATLDWLGFVARRQEPAKLLLLVTMRSGERGTPLEALKLIESIGIQDHGIVVEVPPLDLGNARELIQFASTRELTETSNQVHRLHERSRGNPLFLKNIVVAMNSPEASIDIPSFPMDQFTAGSTDLPTSLRNVISHRLDGLPATWQRMLRAGSVVGRSFAVANVAATLECDLEHLETEFYEIATTTDFLRGERLEKWPDGTESTCWVFSHELYREVLYGSIPAALKARFHRCVAEALESGFGDSDQTVAADLSIHWERGGNRVRAADFHYAAAENALKKVAYSDAVAHLQAGISLIHKDDSALDVAEAALDLRLHLALGSALIASSGGAASEVERVYEHVAMMSRSIGNVSAEFAALFGLRSVALTRGHVKDADLHGRELLEIANYAEDERLKTQASLAVANTSFQLGKLTSAERNLEHALGIVNTEDHVSDELVFGMHPGIFAYGLQGIVHELSGRRNEADVSLGHLVALEEGSSHGFSRATAANFTAWLFQIRNSPAETAAASERAIEIASEYGFPAAEALGHIRHGWATAMAGEKIGGDDELMTGIQHWKSLGNALGLPQFLSLLADVRQLSRDPDAALVCIEEALRTAEETHEHWTDARLLRQRAEISRKKGLSEQAEGDLAEALSIARAQRAELFENEVRELIFAAPNSP